MITCAKRFQDSEHGLIDDNNMYAKVTVESAAPVKVDNVLIKDVNNRNIRSIVKGKVKIPIMKVAFK